VVKQKTGNLKLVPKLLGHSNLSTTADVYTHTSAKKVVERQVSEPGAGQVRIRVEAKLRRLFRARGYAIGRKKLVISHPKLKEVVHRSF
jgi:hypothetical protein